MQVQTIPKVLAVLVTLISWSADQRSVAQPPAPPPVWPGEQGPTLGPPQFGPADPPPPSVFPSGGPPPSYPGDVVYPSEQQPFVEWGPYGPFTADTLFFFGVELALVSPVAHNGLRAEVPLSSGGTATVAPTRAELSWTVSPRFTFGYELPDNQGAFALAYRFLVSEGNETTGMPTTANRSRLDVNVIDFDYTSPNISDRVRWQIAWFLGGRLTTAFYDTQNVGTGLETKASNHFVGGGVHLGLEAQREIALLPGWSFFGTADGAVVVGQIQQRFSRITPGVEDSLFRRHSQSVPMFRVEAGLTYRPPRMDYLRFWVGYQFEYWWSLGNLDGADLELATQGVFLRGEIRY